MMRRLSKVKRKCWFGVDVWLEITWGDCEANASE